MPRRRALDPAVIDRLAAIALILACLLAYAPALAGGYVWDDHLVTDNPLLRTPEGLLYIWLRPSEFPLEAHYWPLTYTSFWLDHQLWGGAPAGYHAVNLVLHALTTLLAWRLLRRLELRAAWAAALLFALHPVHVESVAWIIERKDLLSGALGLGALLAFCAHARAPRPARYALASALFVGALLSKSVVVTLPLTLALLLWWREGALSRRRWLELAPWMAAASAYALLDLWFVRQHDSYQFALSWLQRALIAGRAVLFYAGKLLFPAGLTSPYPRWDVGVTSVCAWIALILSLAAPLVLWLLRRRLGRGPLVAVLCYELTLAPMLGLVDFNFMRHAFVADRFQYLACLAPLALLATLGERALGPARRRLGWVLLGALAVTLGALCWWHSSAYQSMERLFTRGVERAPGSATAHSYLGYARALEGRYAEAVESYRRALDLAPEDVDTLNNLGAALHTLGQLEAARETLERAVALRPAAPTARVNLALMAAASGDRPRAETILRQAIAAAPRSIEPRVRLGDLLVEAGRTADAVAAYRGALSMRRSSAAAHRGLGRALLAQGDVRGAETSLRSALRWDPDDLDGHAALGDLYGQQGRTAEALLHHQEALRLNGADGAAHFNVASDLARLGRLQQARRHFAEAARLDPRYVGVIEQQAAQLEAAGQGGAAQLLRQALEDAAR